MSLLVATGLRYQHDGRVLFDDLSFSVRAGEQLAVVGPSGSGKTSLLAVLAGLSPAAAGKVTLDGQPLDAAARRGFGVVLQSYGLVSLLTAAENVEVALRATGETSHALTSLAHQALAGVGLEGMENHLIEELSGGQQQRVAVARALATQPAVVLADEPTSEQDPLFRTLVMARLLEVSERGGILVLATHDPEVAAQCNLAVEMRPLGQRAGS